MAIRGNTLPEGGAFHAKPFEETIFNTEDYKLFFAMKFQVEGDVLSEEFSSEQTWGGLVQGRTDLGILWSGEPFTVTFFSTGHTGPVAVSIENFEGTVVYATATIAPGTTESDPVEVTLGESDIAYGIAYLPNQPDQL